MGKRTLEIITGLIVLIVVCVFLIFVVITVINSNKPNTYTLYAPFSNVGGLDIGSSVILNGVKVGTVNNVKIDPQTLKVNLELAIDKTIQIPIDTLATIDTSDLVGTKVVILKVGESLETFKNKQTITNTKSFVSLEQKIGDLITTVVK